MTAFGSLRFINVGSCMSDETAQRLGLKTSLKKARYVDEESKLAWTILSISVVNDGCFFVEALFVAVLNKPRETCSVLHNLRKLMPSICSKRREQHGKVLRELVECPCNFIVVNPSAAEKSREVMEKASIRCRLFTELNLAIKIQESQAPLNAAARVEHSPPPDLFECHLYFRAWANLGDCSSEAIFGKRKNPGDLGGHILASLGIYPSVEAQQQPHQQQAAAATPRLSLVDKEQEEEEAAVSQRQLLQLRAQQAFELSCSRQKSQQPSESTQQLDIKASSMSPSWRASYPLGSTQATESEAWHTLQAE